MSKIIYLVDDEPGVLQILGALLRQHDLGWRVEEFSTPTQVLAAVKIAPPHLVLADQRLPGMTGGQMLETIRQMAPQTIRIIVAAQGGFDDKIGAAHQYLSKPFDPRELENRIRQALDAQSSLQNPDLARLMTSLNSFPALPAIYTELARELEKADSSLERAAELISRDGSILTRVIQLANSPLFRGSSPITESSEALLQLGTSNVKALVLSLHVFRSYRPLRCPEMPVEAVWNRSLKTARLAQELCRRKLGESAANDAFFAGLVLDLGCLILMENDPERFRRVCQTAIRERKPLLEVEQEVFHASHQELSAFMLRLWGLPQAVIHAVAHCHAPWSGPGGNQFSPTVALYMADILTRQKDPAYGFVTPALNEDYLRSVGAPDVSQLPDAEN
jgi:HD-like signal output (HDOD) protein/CheY-like chemotaxis protein